MDWRTERKPQVLSGETGRGQQKQLFEVVNVGSCLQNVLDIEKGFNTLSHIVYFRSEGFMVQNGFHGHEFKPAALFHLTKEEGKETLYEFEEIFREKFWNSFFELLLISSEISRRCHKQILE